MTRTERNLHMGSPTKDTPTGTLTYSEAYALAQKGAKITHRFMAANEWMTVLPNGRICFEDGCEQTVVLGGASWSNRMDRRLERI